MSNLSLELFSPMPPLLNKFPPMNILLPKNCSKLPYSEFAPIALEFESLVMCLCSKFSSMLSSCFCMAFRRSFYLSFFLCSLV